MFNVDHNTMFEINSTINTLNILHELGTDTPISGDAIRKANR